MILPKSIQILIGYILATYNSDPPIYIVVANCRLIGVYLIYIGRDLGIITSNKYFNRCGLDADMVILYTVYTPVRGMARFSNRRRLVADCCRGDFG
jgi:hypothetical protein